MSIHSLLDGDSAESVHFGVFLGMEYDTVASGISTLDGFLVGFPRGASGHLRININVTFRWFLGFLRESPILPLLAMDYCRPRELTSTRMSGVDRSSIHDCREALEGRTWRAPGGARLLGGVDHRRRLRECPGPAKPLRSRILQGV